MQKSIVRRDLRTLLALVLAISGLIVPIPSSAAESRLYAGHASSTRFQGIDGYIRLSGTILSDCSNQFIASWIDIGADPWVQIGLTQGTLLNNCSPNDIRIYAEQWDCDGAKFAQLDLGAPPTPNYALYVNRTGASNIDPCTQNPDYQWAFRTGSWTSAPKAYAYVNMYSAGPQAMQEVFWTTSRPGIGTNWWGLNHSGQVQAGYALHLYTPSSSWQKWTSSQAPGSYVVENAPLNHTIKSYFSAFQASD